MVKMTEVVSLIPPDHRIASVKRYEAGPPPGLELVEPGETVATTKEEEWISKKKTEVTNTKQIETRVKRQVVLEDGKVVEDSGPMVTTNTTEDTETQEHHQTELRKLGDDDDDGAHGAARALEGVADVDGAVARRTSGPVAVPNPDGVVREVKERKVVSREETEEVKETEDVQHLGDITDEDFLAAVRSGARDLRKVLRTTTGDEDRIVSTGPRLVRDSTKTKKVTDTEDTRELSSVRPDGRIVTETERTTEHEEVGDEELPEDAPGEEEDFVKESSQRYLKTREQEDVEYLADGVNIGGEMRFKTETMEVERRGDGLDEPDLFDSLSARARRRNNNNNRQQPHRYRGIENGGGVGGVVVGATSLDRKDALTRKPLDFDQEEETRKAETSKWLEHHFGSDSRSSNNSLVDGEDPEAEPTKPTSFFNVTIKSQPTNHNAYVSTVNNTSSRVYSPVEPERDRNHVGGGYYKGIADWSERRHAPERLSPPTRHSPTAYYAVDVQRRPPSPRRPSPSPDYRPAHSPTPDYRPAYHQPRPSPVPDYARAVRPSPRREPVAPTPPQRKRAERYRQRVAEERRFENGFRNVRLEDERDHAAVEEPPPDYSPPSPPPMPPQEVKRHAQKTRFAVVEAPAKPQKSGNIIGQSIRKLVGKIRSASAERKAKQRAKRSPSPTYQQAQLIDSQISGSSMDRPVQRYYLGEDPFGGSIYGRENKYDGVRPARASRRPPREEPHHDEERRSQSTLGRFSKSTGRLARRPEERSSQTLPRHHQARRDDTINVSIINTVSSPEGPAKPARTYRSNLARSKSLNAHAAAPERREMYTSNPQLNRLDEKPIGLKSPGLISSLSRRDEVNDRYHHQLHRLAHQQHHSTTGRFAGNGFGGRDPLEEDEDVDHDVYEPPTRLPVARRGSSSSTDYSETYRTTTRGDDPLRPSVTNTTKSFTRKTVPARGGRGVETIQSSEVKSVTRSRYRGEPVAGFYEDARRYNSPSPVVIEVRSYRK